MWVVELVSVIWTWFFDQWEIRNNFVHSTASDHICAAQEKLTYELTCLHNLRHDVLEIDRDRFLVPDANVTTLFDRFSHTFLQNWISIQGPLLRDSAKKAALARKKSNLTLWNCAWPLKKLPKLLQRPTRQHTRHDGDRVKRHRPKLLGSKPITSFFPTTRLTNPS